ncbi:MAG: DHCW motif cupin fold protein [Chitinophagaceae bacterium]
MTIPFHPFQITDWDHIAKEIHQGDSGTATWQVLQVGHIRVRMVEYSAAYEADHWCSKGHIILCVQGEMETTLEDGRIMVLKQGMSYQVGDGNEAHRTKTKEGCRLFIVD